VSRGQPGPAAGSLGLRVASALVLAPASLLAAWYGHPWFALLVGALGAVMAWEWVRLCRPSGSLDAFDAAAIVAPALAVLLGTLEFWLAGLVVLAGAALGLLRHHRGHPVRRWLAPGGLIYVGLACAAVVWLRGGGGVDDGGADGALAGRRALILWLLAVVWATDIGAFAAGRGLGGPRLWPAVSPKKTWAGLAGAMVSAAAAAAAVAALLAPGAVSPGWAAAAGGGLAVVGQLGDLAESGVKRYFGVKDASRLIPGHGGALDRLDGMLAVVLVVAAVIWARAMVSGGDWTAAGSLAGWR